MHSESRTETIRQLASRLRQLERPRADQPVSVHWSTGSSQLDALLPDRGVLAGSLLEWLQAGPGSGAGSVVLNLLGQVLDQSLLKRSDAGHEGRGRRGAVADARAARLPNPAIVIVDRQRQFSAAGIDPESRLWRHLVVVRPGSDQDALWAWEQSLRSPGVLGAVYWAESIPDRSLRRIKLATESGGGLAMLIRGARWKRATSWADVRLEVRGLPADHVNKSHQAVASTSRSYEIRLLACRGGLPGSSVARVTVPEPVHSAVDRRA